VHLAPARHDLPGDAAEGWQAGHDPCGLVRSGRRRDGRRDGRWARIADLLDNPEHFEAELERMRASDPTETDLAAIDRSLVTVARAIEGLAKGMATVQTEGARAILAQQLDAAAAQRRQLQDERQRVLELRQGWLDAQRRVEEVQSWLRELRGAVDDMPYALRRKTLPALDVRVVVYPPEPQSAATTPAGRARSRSRLGPTSEDKGSDKGSTHQERPSRSGTAVRISSSILR
jgi:hypothetical protein